MNEREALGRVGSIAMVVILLVSMAAGPVAGTPTETTPEKNGSDAGGQPTDVPSNSTQGPPNNTTETETSTSTQTKTSINEGPSSEDTETATGGSEEDESWVEKAKNYVDALWSDLGLPDWLKDLVS